MPTYTYKCNDCGTKYDVFHKTISEAGEVECPSCNSASSKKLMSAANIGSISSSKSSADVPSCPAYGNGCSSGMCGMN